MIKFFRHIRKDLMVKNKTGKYFKYAIGEILLVMIGILLALQVSNWNTKRVKNNLERTTLLQLKDDVGAMLNDMEGDYEVLKMGIRSHLKIVNYLEQNVNYNDTMCFDFHWLIKDEYIYPITSSYDLLKKEGLELIKNDSIRMIAQRAFEYNLPRISKQNPFYPDLESFFGEFYRQNFIPNSDSELVYEYKMYDVNFKYPYKDSFEGEVFDVYFGYVPNDFTALKQNSEFKMLLRQSLTYRSFKVNRYKSAIYWLKELDRLIDKEFKTE